MDIVKFTRRIRLRDVVYGLVGALLMSFNCYIATFIYPQMPEFVFVIVIALGFLAGFWDHSRFDHFAISWRRVTKQHQSGL